MKLNGLGDRKSLEQISSSQDNTRPNSSDSRGPNTPVMKGMTRTNMTKEEPMKRQFFPKE